MPAPIHNMGFSEMRLPADKRWAALFRLRNNATKKTTKVRISTSVQTPINHHPCRATSTAPGPAGVRIFP
jgi:hypothetical protein